MGDYKMTETFRRVGTEAELSTCDIGERVDLEWGNEDTTPAVFIGESWERTCACHSGPNTYRFPYAIARVDGEQIELIKYGASVSRSVLEGKRPKLLYVGTSEPVTPDDKRYQKFDELLRKAGIEA